MTSPSTRITRSKDSPSVLSDLPGLLEKNKKEIIQSIKPELKNIHEKLSSLEERIDKFESKLTSIFSKQAGDSRANNRKVNQRSH